MITKEIFKSYLENWDKFDKYITNIEKSLFPNERIFSSLKETEWFESVGVMLDLFLKTNFTKEGQDCINDYLFGRLDGLHIITVIYPKDIFKEEYSITITNLDDLWGFLKSSNYIL